MTPTIDPHKKSAEVEHTLQPPASPAEEKAKDRAPSAVALKAPPEESTGEKIFHKTTYWGVGYLANLALSVVIWDFLADGRGKPVLDKVAKGAGKLIHSSGMAKDEAAAMRFGETMAYMGSSPLGGHIVMIPVKLLEDRARWLTHKFNQWFNPRYPYKNLNVSPKEAEKELPPMVDEPNSQTWPQIIMRRGIGWVLVTGAGLGLRSINDGKLEHGLQNATLKATQSVLDATGSKTLQKLNQNARFGRYMKLVALDCYFTIITSVWTAMTKNWFGKSKDKDADDANPQSVVEQITALEKPQTSSTTGFAERVKPRESIEKRPAAHAEAVLAQPGSEPTLAL